MTFSVSNFNHLPWFDDQLVNMVERYDRKTFPQALLLIGEQDIGKSIFAKDLAKSILCLDRSNSYACGHCQSCIWIDKNSHPDFLSVESEEKSHFIKVDQIRHLIQFAQMTSETGRKIIVIHNAHEMNLNAANALLKTLEEPMANCYLILVTSFPKKLPITISSRCQRQIMSLHEKEAVIIEWLRKVSPETSMDQLNQLISISYGRPILSCQFLSQDIMSTMNELDGLLVRYLHHRNNLHELSDFIVKNWHFSSHILLYWIVSVLKNHIDSNIVMESLSQKTHLSLYDSYEGLIKIIELSSTSIKQEWLIQDWLLKL